MNTIEESLNWFARTLRILLIAAVTAAGIGISSIAQAEVLYTLDFTKQQDGNAIPWLKENGVELGLDAGDLDPRFENQSLVLSTKDDIAGMFVKKLAPEKFLHDVKHIEIEWGVIRHSKGAGWEDGNNRVPVALMFFFGTKELSSGLPFGVNSAPYFIGAFIGQKEKSGKVYTGKLYKEGGRYLCAAVADAATGVVTTRIEVDQRFQKLFDKRDTPPVTAIAFQMNAKDTEGGAKSFIRRIRFMND